MAENDRTVRILLEAEVKQAQGEISKLEAEVRRLGGSLTNTAGAASQADKAMDSISGSSQKLNQGIGASIGALTGLKTSVGGLGTGFEDATGQVEELGQQSTGTFSNIGSLVTGATAGLIKFALAFGVVLSATSLLRSGIGFIRDSIREAASEEGQLIRLAQAVEITGISFESVKDQVIATADEIQKFTAFSDSEVYDALQRLVIITGDYNKSLAALPTVLDLAAGLENDLVTTSSKLSLALEGNFSGLGKFATELKKVDVELFNQLDSNEKLAIILGVVKDKVLDLRLASGKGFEADIKQLGFAWDDFKQSVGDLIIDSPALIGFLEIVKERVREWTNELNNNEELQNKVNEAIQKFLDATEDVPERIKTISTGLFDLHGFLKSIDDALNSVLKTSTGWGQYLHDQIVSGLNFTEEETGLGTFGLAISDAMSSGAQRGINKIRDLLGIEIPKLEVPEIQILTPDQANIVETFTKDLGVLNIKFKETARVSDEAETSYEKLLASVLKGGSANKDAAKAVNEHEKALERLRKTNESFSTLILERISTAQAEIDSIGKTNAELIKLDAAQLKSLASALGLKGGWSELIDVMAETEIRADGLAEALQDINKIAEQFGAIFNIPDLKLGAEALKATTDEIEKLKGETFAFDDEKDSIDSFAVFVGSTFANIAQDISNAIIGAGSVWDAVVNSMKSVVGELIGFLIINPIRLAFEGGGAGTNAEGQNTGGFIKNLGGLFSGGSGALKNIFTGVFEGITGLFKQIGDALPLIGAAIGIITAGISLISGLLKKSPDINIAIGQFKDGMNATIADLLAIQDVNSEIAKELIKISKKGDVFAGPGGEGVQKVREAIKQVIDDTIGVIQDIIFTLPTDLADQLSEALLATTLDASILGFGKSGGSQKDIQKRLEIFFGGELSAKIVEASGDFFITAFEALGVETETAIKLVTDQFDEFLKITGSGVEAREQRAAFGQDFLAQFQAFVDAFNFISEAGKSEAEIARETVEKFAHSLGFEFIPTVDEVREHLRQLLEAGEIDPTIVAEHIQLADAIEGLGDSAGNAASGIDSLNAELLDMARSILSVISQLQSVNQSIQALGGSGTDVTGSLTTVIDTYQNVIASTELTADAQAQLLNEMKGAVDQLVNEQLAQQQAIADAQFRQAQAQAEAENKAIEARRDAIDNEITKLKTSINLQQEKSKKEIESLNKLIQNAERFKTIADNIGKDLQNLLTSPSSPLNTFEQLAFIQSEILKQRTALTRGTPEQRQDALEQIRQLENQLFEVGSRAFGQDSPAFNALFKSVVSELEDLKKIADLEGNKADILQQTLERVQNTLEKQTIALEKRIESLQSISSSLQTQSIQVQQQQAQLTSAQKEQALAYYKFIQERLAVILQQKLDELKIAQDEETLTQNQFQNANIQQLVGIRHDTGMHTIIMQDQLAQLTKLNDTFGNAKSVKFHEGGTISEPGFGFFPRSGTRFTIGELEKELIIPYSKLAGLSAREGTLNLAIKLEDVTGGGTGTASIVARELLRLLKDWLVRGEGREIIQNIKGSILQ